MKNLRVIYSKTGKSFVFFVIQYAIVCLLAVITHSRIGDPVKSQSARVTQNENGDLLV